MDYIDYREKLGLSFNDKEKQEVFITRVFSYLTGNSSVEFSNKDEKEFCYQVCIKSWYEEHNPNFSTLIIVVDEPTGLSKLAYYLNKRRNEFRDFLSTLVFFLNIFSGKKSIKEKLWQDVRRMLEDSHIQYDLLEDNNNLFIFPKGAKELDNALVSQPLEWLSSYPIAQTAFVKALKLYADASNSNASEIADNFRKALESFFQEFFSSKRALEKLKSEYGSFLKSKDIPAEISNNLEKLLELYTKFINNNAKHHDRTSKNILEYIMYQTGNIIRLLITLKNEEKHK